MTERSSNGLSLTMCITELDVGGAERAVVRIAVGLRDNGWSVRVISLRDKGPLAQPLEEAGIAVTALGCRGLADIRAYWRLRSELTSHPPDVLLTFLHQANIYGRLAGRSAGIQRIVCGIRVADRRAWVTWPERMTRGCVDQYVAVSPSVGATHTALCGLDPSAMTAIPNGVDVPREDSEIAAVRNSAIVLFVGRLSPQKDPLSLLEAFRRLPESLLSQTELRYVGDGPLRDALQRKIGNSDLPGRVHLHGKTDKVEQFMQESTLLVLPSRWEGLPNVVLEAMSLKLPVVATRVDGCADLISDGESGWLVPAADPQALSDVIGFCLQNPDERRRRAENAYAMVVADYSWPSVVLRYDKLLRSLTSGQG